MFRRFNWIATGILFLFWTGCAGRIISQPGPVPDRPAPAVRIPQPPGPEIQRPRESGKAPDDRGPAAAKSKPTPQSLASVELVDQGRLLIERQRPDDAIRVLERAVNLHPQNGQSYYYLAEAWLKKGNPLQAEEFHRLAVIYLPNDRLWSSRLKIQEQRIEKF